MDTILLIITLISAATAIVAFASARRVRRIDRDRLAQRAVSRTSASRVRHAHLLDRTVGVLDVEGLDGPGDRLPALASAAPRLGNVLFLEGRESAESIVALAVEATRQTVDDARWINGRVAAWPPSVREELLGRALGRVLAHEIGHYLLVWRAHTPDGLMRAAFRGEALIQPGRRAFELSDRLVPRLRARLAQLSPSASTVAAIR